MSEIKIGETWQAKGISSTGCMRLDAMTKYQGLPYGSIIQYYSPPKNEGSGKTTLGLNGLAQMQQQGHKIGVIDVERTPMDKQWLESLGIKTDKSWHYSRPVDGEDAISTLKEMVIKYECKGIMFDSIDMARTNAYNEGDGGESHMGSHAKLIRKLYQDFKTYSENHNTTFFVINQSRDPISTTYAQSENITGGQASYYYPTISIRMRRESDSKIEDSDLILVKMQIKRSKLGGSWKKFVTGYIQGHGFDPFTDMLFMCNEHKIIRLRKKKGFGEFWENWEKEVIGKDTLQARNWIFDNKKKVANKLINIKEYEHINYIKQLSNGK